MEEKTNNINNKEIELAPVRDTSPIIITSEFDVDSIVRSAEKYVELFNRLRQVAVKLTTALDWCDQHGTPYLEKSGCDKIASAFGLQIKDPEFKREYVKDDLGEYIIYTCTGIGIWRNAVASEIGTASSRDDFFGKVGNTLRPLSEVDLTDIKKKAFTNLSNRLIKRLLNLTFTWEELEELSGGKITRETVKKIVYKNSKEKAPEKSSEQHAHIGKQQADTQLIAQRREELRSKILAITNGDTEEAKNLLEKLTSFTNEKGETIRGKRSVDALSEAQLNVTIGKVNKLLKEMGGPNEQ